MRLPASHHLNATLRIARRPVVPALLGLVVTAGTLVSVAGSRGAASGLLAAAAFALLALAAWSAGARAATWIAVLFLVYGGVSAAIAVQDSGHKFPASFGNGSYRYALVVTVLSGLAATSVAWIVARRTRRPPGRAPIDVDTRLTERAGKLLVAVGFAGVVAASARFALTAPLSHGVWNTLKSFWMGGSYFLLVASFAVPGFGLWLHGALLRGSGFRDLRLFWLLLVVYGAASVPTGQRGFLVQIALMLAAVALYRRIPRVRTVLAVGLIGVVAIGVTQAVRNDARETGTVTVSEIVSRMAPAKWATLYGSQLASFQWTWDVARHRPELTIPNTFVSALLKPVPRQLYPKKVQGFGEEFTKRLYPEANAEHVSFATPLVAEADYSFGLPGAIALLALLGALAGWAESRAARAAPRALRPILAAAVVWCVFVFVRGDLANALVVATGWILPLAVVCACVGFWPRRLGGRALPALLERRRAQRIRQGVQA